MDIGAMLSRVKTALQITDAAKDALLHELLVQAGEEILLYTNRTTMPEALQGAQIRLAIVLYTRLGTEGETSHAEGGISVTMEGMPANIAAMCRPYVQAKAGW